MNLNWRELHCLIHALAPQILGRWVDQVSIIERSWVPETFLKGETGIRLSQHGGSLLFSLKPHQVYLCWHPQIKLRSAPQATLSGFQLSLRKHLVGRKLIRCEALPEERIVWFEWSRHEQTVGLVLHLIPSAPEGYLIQLPQNPIPIQEGTFPVISQSHSREKITTYTVPKHPKPAWVALRPEFENQTPADFISYWNQTVEETLKNNQKQQHQQAQAQALKLLRKQYEQTQVSLQKAQNELDWQTQADAIKATLNTPLSEPTTSQALIQKMELLYQRARQKKTKIHNLNLRLKELEQRLEKPLLLKTKNPTAPHLPPGRVFYSTNGFPIHVGRNLKENQFLTFHWAKGSYVWMHLRNQPGAHVLIAVPPKQSPPLETLLEAAYLAIFYSLNKPLGPIEVDYTLKKYVRRIKKTDQVQYTHQKTLQVELNPAKLQVLLKNESFVMAST